MLKSSSQILKRKKSLMLPSPQSLSKVKQESGMTVDTCDLRWGEGNPDAIQGSWDFD